MTDQRSCIACIINNRAVLQIQIMNRHTLIRRNETEQTAFMRLLSGIHILSADLQMIDGFSASVVFFQIRIGNRLEAVFLCAVLAIGGSYFCRGILLNACPADIRGKRSGLAVHVFRGGGIPIDVIRLHGFNNLKLVCVFGIYTRNQLIQVFQIPGICNIRHVLRV